MSDPSVVWRTMNSNEHSDVVIIGGVAAGPKTAATLMRRNPNLRVTLFQKEEYLSYATCGMPYFASGDIDSFEDLIKTSYGVPRTAEFFEKSKGFTAIPSAEAIHIDRDKKLVTVKLLQEDRVITHGYDKLVLATGATPSPPPFPVDEHEHIGCFTRAVDAIQFRRLAQTGQIGSVTIIGGGFIGCELAEAAAGLWGIETTLIECKGQLLPLAFDTEIARLIKAEMTKQGVRVITGAQVERVSVSDSGQIITFYKAHPEQRGKPKEIRSDYTFVCVGVRPEVSLARMCGLQIGVTGGIKVNQYMQTSDPDIYAGGDCVESVHRLTGKELFLPMGSLANRHGRIIAEHIVGNDIEFPGVLGAFIIKVFDINAGSVGLTEHDAELAGIPCLAVWGAFPDKPEYYPESKSFLLKMVYESGTMKLLGLQVVGTGNICRRIDVFSSFLQRKATVSDLLDFEHCYAPPYAEALDPLHHMAALAFAQKRGMRFINPGIDFKAYNSHTQWLDVREPEEIDVHPAEIQISGTPCKVIKIPLNNLRERMNELAKDKPVVIICRRGPRSYQAATILQAAGFADVYIIAGGTTALALEEA